MSDAAFLISRGDLISRRTRRINLHVNALIDYVIKLIFTNIIIIISEKQPMEVF